MYFFQSPSLECLTLVKIATLLFDEYQAYDVFLMQKVRSPPQSLRYKDWTRSIFERVEYDMELRAEKLPLPEKLKNKIYSLFRPLAVQVLYWKEYDDDYFVFKMFQRNFKKVSWTQQGIIDKRKTYEPVVKFQALDVEYRYKLACKCCLENDIPVLWEQMLETERNKIIFNTRDSSIIDLRDLLDGLLYFWSCKMKGEVFSLKDMTENYSTYTPSQYMFEYAAVKGNKAALAYFFEKLTPDEKNYSLLKTAKHVCSLCYYNMRYDNPYCYYGDILCFLLSQIDKEQHKDVIEKNYGVLFHFLEWPCQGFVLDAADLVWADIKGDLFVKLLYQVAVKIMLHYEDYNYRELLGEFCHRSLSSHKKYIFDCQCSEESVLATLLKLGDFKNMKRILKDATTEEIKKLIFDHSDNCVCYWLFDLTYDWLSSDDDDFRDATGLYRNFVCEYISNKDDIEKFKDGIKNHVLRLWKNTDDSEYIRNKLDCFLEGFPNEDKKRSAEDVSTSKCKALKSCP